MSELKTSVQQDKAHLIIDRSIYRKLKIVAACRDQTVVELASSLLRIAIDSTPESSLAAQSSQSAR